MDTIKGLTQNQVKQRIKEDKVNHRQKKLTKTYKEIFTSNTFTLFNLFNIIILLALLSVGAYTNILFMGVVISNWFLSIYQEIKAKRILENLTLLNKSEVTVLREDTYQKISTELLVIDDVVELNTGIQVPSDLIILQGQVEVNESLLTGEADNIAKSIGETLLSGSYVVSGKVLAKVINVGKDNYVNKITAGLKNLKTQKSELLTQLNKIVKIASIFIIPFAIILLFSGLYIQGNNLRDVVVTTAASLIGIMPKGLVLLTTLSLMVGVIKLARKKTLAQDLTSVEMLARVDMICLDKTGTITTGEMKVINYHSVSDDQLILNSIIKYNVDSNATITAIRKYLKSGDILEGNLVESFSSERKYSSVNLKGKGTYYLGANEILFKDSDPFNLKASKTMSRYIVLAYCKKENQIGLNDELIPLGYFEIVDTLRDNAQELIEYFYSQDVDIKIISGDNPITVSVIGKSVGIRNYDKYLDLSEVKKIDNDCLNYTVFGRSSPWQKQELIKLFQNNGNTVAMTGDGVNDILALRQANCSITVKSGSDAARQVSQLILMDDDFSFVPNIINEGRRVVNNITLVASLFLVKTVFSFLITIITILTGSAFPYIPIHMTVVGMFAEGIPAFILALQPSEKKVNNRFMESVYLNTLPTGILITIYYLIIQFLLPKFMIVTSGELSSLLVLITGFVWLVQLFIISQPFNILKFILWISMEIGFFSTLFIFKDFLEISTLNLELFFIFILLAGASYFILLLLKKLLILVRGESIVEV